MAADTEPTEPLVASIKETRRLLGGLHTATVYRLFERGMLEKRKIGSRTFVTMASIKRVLEAA